MAIIWQTSWKKSIFWTTSLCMYTRFQPPPRPSVWCEVASPRSYKWNHCQIYEMNKRADNLFLCHLIYLVGSFLTWTWGQNTELRVEHRIGGRTQGVRFAVMFNVQSFLEARQSLTKIWISKYNHSSCLRPERWSGRGWTTAATSQARLRRS